MPKKLITEADYEQHRQYTRAHYAANRQYYADKRARRQKEVREYVRSLKSVPCLDCGVSYPPYVMEFHHRNPTEKEHDMNRLANNGSYVTIDREAGKCDILCANCHRMREYS